MANEIVVDELTSVSQLAELRQQRAAAIVQFGFRSLGLLLTIDQKLSFDQTRAIAEGFGYGASQT